VGPGDVSDTSLFLLLKEFGVYISPLRNLAMRMDDQWRRGGGLQAPEVAQIAVLFMLS